MALFNSAPASICILRLSAIGDVCNVVAVVQSIQRQWPTTKITWITGKLEAQLIGDLPNIDVIVFDKKQGWKAYSSLWSQLRSQHFDALLHMQYAFRASIATIGIKAKYKLGFDAARSQDFQTWFTNVKVPSPSGFHVLDGLFAFAKYLGVEDTTPKWSLTYSQDDLVWAQQFLHKTSRNLIVVPGASKAYKNWHVDGYAEIITYVQELGWNVILAGSPAKVELDLAQEIESKLQQPITNLVGSSSLKQMLALLAHADLVLAPDTGPAHMANAVKTPVIGLYAHHNPKRTGPYCYQRYVVSAYDDAIKAETGKNPDELSWRTRVKDEKAMNRIQASQVIQVFNMAVEDFKLSPQPINSGENQ
ncbi:glycosyltransferase family 9 protein [Vibrio viridaestus]|uniref:Lipopolysaccharide heptosyltransferase family protein n=1 Tax=Vibrio viridaestus TaxID=2487322 RepID=A0A3N9TXT3_9VIBR|nr:glycosyltransferase family 9 protein [Vibrio viridaestus]RQW61732.1 lipopolysaccharide heptosyltransferase family protein [Vibrio viridaestus]